MSRPLFVGVVVTALFAHGLPAPVRADEADSQPSPVTYARDVAPILQANCQECHRPGGIGPFSLLTYEEARDRATQIREYTTRRIMPPWKAAEGYGEFRDALRLTETQIRTIATWVEAGTPLGDLKELPQPREFAEDWTVGSPDLVLAPEQPFAVPAGAGDLYRSFVLPYAPQEDRWIRAVEILPGSRDVVHHVILYIDPKGVTPELDRADPGPGFRSLGTGAGFSPAMILGGYTPGRRPLVLPDGLAWRVPAHSRVVMQIHFHARGGARMDRTRVGLHFARAPVAKRVRFSVTGNLEFEIPAGATDFAVSGSRPLPVDITLLAVIPHMHRLGRQMKVWASLPDGSRQPLIWIPDWEFEWQTVYPLKTPMRLPRGARIDLLAIYDNSEGNPHSPHHPPRPVRHGPLTSDEMCLCFFAYVVDPEHLTQGVPVEVDGLEIR